MPKRPSGTDAAAATEIDWPLLRSFVAVVRGGSLSQAARALGTTQPTIGRHVRALEQRIGETLFDRLPGGLRPTTRATELFERAIAVDQAVAGLSASVLQASPELAGVVRVTTSLSFAVEVLPALMAPLLDRHAGLQLELIASDAVSNLLRREADVAVRFVRPDQPDVVAVQACELPMGLYAHRDYLARHGLPHRPADWAAQVLIGMEDPAVTLAAASTMGLTLRREAVRFRCDTYLAQIAALRAGIGIGACQVWMAARDPALVRLDPGAALPPLQVWVAAHDDLHRSRRIRTVFDHLVDGLRARFGA